MKGILSTTLLMLILLAGCESTGGHKNLGHEGGEPYTDVPVPVGYEAYDTPPFKRQDGADQHRIYGRYAYKSSNGLDSSKRVAGWFKTNLPKDGWELQTEQFDDAKGTMSLRFTKGDDTVLLKLAPDERLQGSERFSILIVEMNPQYD